MHEIVRIPDNAAELPEQLGTKYKFWFSSQSGGLCLFKEGRPNTGENWAEKVSYELAKAIGLPCAEYEFAYFRDKKGVITPTFVPDGGRLVHGNELLAKLDPGYDTQRFWRVHQHTLARVLAILRNRLVLPPLGFEAFPGIENALDVFLGYLMLDCWISNQDRHHENWALILTANQEIHLAPTYDHGSSLGRNETDDKRDAMLTTRDKGQSVESYVARARSAFFPPMETDGNFGKPLLTFAAFENGAMLRRSAAIAWLKKLENINEEQIAVIFSKLPVEEISNTASQFAQRMLLINKNRLTRLLGTL